MSEVLISPDAELAAVTWLRSRLGSLASRVGTQVPSTMPETMVRVALTGGDRISMAADYAQLTVECWGPDVGTTSNLARRAQGAMFAAEANETAGLFVRKSQSVGGVQSFPDPDTNKPRYIFTVRWYFRPETI